MDTAPKLTGQVQDYIDKTARRERVIGMVAPHAGLMYSGPVAGAVYSAIDFPDTFRIDRPEPYRTRRTDIVNGVRRVGDPDRGIYDR